MKNFKRALSVLLASAMVVSLTACGSESYTVTPEDGSEVNFHTALQQAFLSDPYVDGEIGTPEYIEIDGEKCYIDGNPYTSKDLDERERTHIDYSRPDPITLTWDGKSGKTYYVEISKDLDFAEIDRSLTTEETSVDVYNLEIGTTYYWRVSAKESKLADAEVHNFATSSEGPRNIYIDGVTNVRDIGGYELADGSGKIRQGLVYRGGRLNVSNADDEYVLFQDDEDYFQLTITEAGIDTMVNELGIKSEVDIRSNQNNEPGNMNDDRIEGLTYIHYPMDYYGGEATDNNFTRLDNPQSIKAFFELLADEDNYPVYFHCNIGTDRTGCLAYLLGALLGMDEEDLYTNYVFSNFGSIAGSVNASGRQISSLTSETGYATTVLSYPGDTLSEKTRNALKDICGLSDETLDKVCEIMIEKY